MKNERTRLFVAMTLMAVILFGWEPLVHLLERTTGYRLMPVPTSQPTPAAQPATLPSGMDTVTAATQPGLTASTRPAGSLTIAVPTSRPADVFIGSATPKDKTYAVELKVSPGGGGLAGVVLNGYSERVGSDDPFDFERPYDDNLQALSTRSVTINGVEEKVTTNAWRVESKTDTQVTLALDLLGPGDVPVLTLRKTFAIETREEGGVHGPLGYETKFTYALENRSDRALIVSSDLVGPTFPPSEQMRGGDRQVIAGYQGKNDVIIRHDALEGFSGSTATRDYSNYENQSLLWFGAGGNYFNGIVRPVVAKGEAGWIKTATATALNPDAEAHQRQVLLEMRTADVTLAPGTSKSMEARVFFGPRKREILKNAYYSAPGLGYQHTLETTGSCAFCTFQWLVDFLMLLLGFFQTILRDWGLAIIALVFVVRACLHPVTKRAQINMANMGKMGPEIERIKKKYGDDKDGLNRAMMEFYKSNGATPVFGCLPMFLQMPIWIALYSGLSSTFELRQAPFLQFFGHNLTWIHDLSKPDHLIQFAEVKLPILPAFDGLNVIPFLLAIAFFLQQKFTPKPPASTPEQAQQQKMMQWMTLLFPLFLYSSPSGLNLYILTSTIFGIIESRIIRKHIKEREALQPTGPTFVDGEIIDRDKNRGGAIVAKPTGGIAGWWAKLQDMAEQARDQAEKKGPGGRGKRK